MRTGWQGLAFAALLVTAGGCAGTYAGSGAPAYDEASSPPDADVASPFWNDLAPYGSWVDVAPYGWCWVPDDATADWRPYTDGQWAYTDWGWAWVSDDPWGWATDHYGRWAWDSDYGWIWVPGSVWAPAWVAWHGSDDWIGWAPLPPEATWEISVGLRFGDVDRIRSDAWCFVPAHGFVGGKVRSRLVPLAMNRRLLAHTRDATHFAIRDGKPVNAGVDVRVVERTTHGHVVVHPLTDVRGPAQLGGGVGRGALHVYRPAVRDAVVRAKPPASARNPHRGWSAAQWQRHYADRQRALDQAVERERAQLRTQHARELRENPKGVDEIRRRQEAERQALEAHAQRQHRVLQQRLQHRLAGLSKSDQANGHARNGGTEPSKSRGRRH